MDADIDHCQIIGGNAVKFLGEYIPPSPPHRVSAPLAIPQLKLFFVLISLQKLIEKYRLMEMIYYQKYISNLNFCRHALRHRIGALI